MEEFLLQMMGKRVDISCGGTSVRGEIVNVKNGIVYLRDEDRAAYVALDKVAVVWEVIEQEMRTGFVQVKAK